MSVGEKIRLYLLENKISQTWVSEQTKISLPKLNASLHNKRRLSVEEFSIIVNVLNVDVNKFLSKQPRPDLR